MKLLNENDIDGPTLKNVFTCDDCRYLVKAAFAYNKPYKCYHDEILKSNKTSYEIMKGDINENKITPDFCPFLLKKMRNEKIKEIINNN